MFDISIFFFLLEFLSVQNSYLDPSSPPMPRIVDFSSDHVTFLVSLDLPYSEIPRKVHIACINDQNYRPIYGIEYLNLAHGKLKAKVRVEGNKSSNEYSCRATVASDLKILSRSKAFRFVLKDQRKLSSRSVLVSTHLFHFLSSQLQRSLGQSVHR